MATLPTPEENARSVLSIFKHFNVRPGEGLLRKVIHVNAGSHKLRWGDVNPGIEKGVTLGWFEEPGRDFIRLTEAGFEEM